MDRSDCVNIDKKIKNTNRNINDDEVKVIVKREFLGIHKLSTLYESIVEKNIDERLKKSPKSSQISASRSCI